MSGDVLITAVNGVDANGIGTPSAVTYDGTIYPDVGQPFTFTGGKPNQPRPDDILKIKAAVAGHTGNAVMIAGNWYFNIPEWPHVVECPPQ
jgi:hypothetical protein